MRDRREPLQYSLRYSEERGLSLGPVLGKMTASSPVSQLANQVGNFLEADFRGAGENSLVRLALPAQPVDATPSNQLIRQYFPWRTDLLAVLGQNLARVAFRLI